MDVNQLYIDCEAFNISCSCVLAFLPACLGVVTSSHHSLCAQKLKEADFQFQATADWQPQKQD